MSIRNQVLEIFKVLEIVIPVLKVLELRICDGLFKECETDLFFPMINHNVDIKLIFWIKVSAADKKRIVI